MEENEKMKKAARIIAEKGGETGGVAEAVGIDADTFEKWIYDTAFPSMIADAADRWSQTQTAGVWSALVGCAEDGSVPAMKLFFEIRDRRGQDGDAAGTVHDASIDRLRAAVL